MPGNREADGIIVVHRTTGVRRAILRGGSTVCFGRPRLQLVPTDRRRGAGRAAEGDGRPRVHHRQHAHEREVELFGDPLHTH